MNTKKSTPLKIISLVALISLALMACSTAIPTSEPVSAEPAAAEETVAISDDPAANSEVVAAGEPSTEDDTTVVVASAAASTLHASGLTEAEVEGLLYMREEEKLAHDVYVTLYGIWGTPVFQNIANSEQTHTEAVKNLLDIYGLEDPPSAPPLASSSTLICKPSMTSW